MIYARPARFGGSDVMYYLACPMYRTDVKHSEKDQNKLKRNLTITKSLEDNGIKIFLPHRNIDLSQPIKDVLAQELEAIEKSDGIIVVLSDTRGAYIEAGYAKAYGKKILGLKVKETRELSKWGHAFFDYVADDLDGLVSHIKGT